MRAHDGRPHWGKVHTRTAADLAPAYPRFDDFLAMRDRLDPDRVFANAYLRADPRRLTHLRPVPRRGAPWRVPLAAGVRRRRLGHTGTQGTTEMSAQELPATIARGVPESTPRPDARPTLDRSGPQTAHLRLGVSTDGATRLLLVDGAGLRVHRRRRRPTPRRPAR